MANSDVLAALSLIADLAGETYKTRAQMMHDERMLAKKAEISENQTRLSHNLRMYESSLERRNKLADDLVEKGVTLKDLDNLSDEFKTDGADIQKSSMNQSAGMLDNTMKGITKLSEEIKLLNKQRRDHSKGVQAYNLAVNEWDLDRNKYLDKEESDRYFDSQGFLKNYGVDEEFKDADGKIHKTRVGQFTDPDAFRVGFESQVPDYKERIAVEESAARMQELKTKKIPETGIEPLSGVAGVDAYQNDFAVESGKQIALQWANADWGTIEDSINQYSQDYKDLAKGVLDYSDVPALRESFKKQAEDWALKHGADAGLDVGDIMDKSEAYYRYEDRYVNNAMKGINKNPIYTAKDVTTLQTQRSEHETRVRNIYKEEFTMLQGADEALTGLIATVDKKGKVKYKVQPKEISKELKKKKVSLSTEKIQKVFNMIINNQLDEFAAQMIAGDKALEHILSVISGGRQFASLIKQARAKISKQQDPYRAHEYVGTETKDKEQEEYNKMKGLFD